MRAWEATDGDEVEEWTVHPTRQHLPDAFTVAEWLTEWAGENGELDECGWDAIADACKGPEGLATIETCLDTIAAQVHYHMAAHLIATHKRPDPSVQP